MPSSDTPPPVPPPPRPGRRRRRTLALCALPVVGLLAAVCLAPLPFTLAQPGITANVLGSYKGQQVITVEGADQDTPSRGELRMVTIAATGPQAQVRIGDVVHGWFATDREVLPTSAVYPVGDSVRQIERHGRKQMRTRSTTPSRRRWTSWASRPTTCTSRCASRTWAGPARACCSPSASSTNSATTAI
jgi:PDZ domain-containing protein